MNHDPSAVVNLVTGSPAPAPDWWPSAAIAIGLAAAACAAILAWQRLCASALDAPERAFTILSRRLGLSPGARALLRCAAEARDCPPVALLLSPSALGDAVERLREEGVAVDMDQVEAMLAGRAEPVPSKSALRLR